MVNTPLYEPAGLPIFLRRGGLLVLGQERTNIDDTPADDLTLYLWPSADGEDWHRLRFSPDEYLAVICHPVAGGCTVMLTNASTVPRSGTVILLGQDGVLEDSASELFGSGICRPFSLAANETATITIQC
ncbi:MAG: hypothetical protein BWY83_03295 [bacterium ADurb.Bin478]|nr:MAG: hypothetical protein BWY83_03295 [bacterium ADurb.Bin478]